MKIPDAPPPIVKNIFVCILGIAIGLSGFTLCYLRWVGALRHDNYMGWTLIGGGLLCIALSTFDPEPTEQSHTNQDRWNTPTG